MNPAAKWYQQLCKEVAQMSLEERREFYLDHFAWLAKVSNPARLDQLREMCLSESMAKQVGAEHCAKLAEVIDGRIALRDLGLISDEK